MKKTHTYIYIYSYIYTFYAYTIRSVVFVREVTYQVLICTTDIAPDTWHPEARQGEVFGPHQGLGLAKRQLESHLTISNNPRLCHLWSTLLN